MENDEGMTTEAFIEYLLGLLSSYGAIWAFL